MIKTLYGLTEVQEKISEGKALLLAGDEGLLKKLPAGQWIAGTIPYFMTEAGGVATKDKIFVTEFPSYVKKITLLQYAENNIANIYKEAPANGFSVVIIPASSPTHFSFALNAPQYEGFATSPLVGWISGVHLDDLGHISPKVYYGPLQEAMEDGAVVMHVELPPDKYVDLNILNIFNSGEGDTITFPEDGFSAGEVLVNGAPVNFVDYIKAHNIDIKLPLVANYCGAMVNTSFQEVDEVNKIVKFYAPVFKEVPYKIASMESDYIKSFNRLMPQKEVDNILFSCNCILNYLYQDLEGKQTNGVIGPITFGEIAYQLLNQTLAYLTIGNLK